MMNSELKYNEVLKAIGGLKVEKKITVVRNVTLEPMFDDYFKFYDNSTGVVYTDIITYLSSNLQYHSQDSKAIVILSLSELNPHLYDNFYSLCTSAVNEEAAKIERTLSALIEKLHCEFADILFFSFEQDFYECDTEGIFSYNDFVMQMNDYLSSLLKNYANIYMVNMNKIIGMIGADKFYNKRGLYSTNSPYSVPGCNCLAYEAVKYFNMIKVQAKKCLILDCDNVLWGGVVSEDGINDIKLSRQFIGKAYRDFQREIMRLYNEGIIICLCSKNNENDVWEVFDSHPDMLLKRDYITAHRINWNNKADNIIEISKELNISLDDIVFIDDSEYETSFVSKMFPQVKVIKFDPAKPHTYADALKKCDLFNKLSITGEAAQRSRMYSEQTKREKQRIKCVNIEEYHKSLKTETEILFADDFSLPRIAELSQRTNQFNLSARKYTADEIAKLSNSTNYDVVYLKASDIFGDMGIVCAAVVSYDGNHALIESFMLSCRVFSRGFEVQMLDYVKERTISRGTDSLYGVYRENSKNYRYKSFYPYNGVTVYE